MGEFVFRTESGDAHDFDTEADMKQFGRDYAIRLLVGKGHITVHEVDGEQVIRITRTGLDACNLKDAVVMH